MNYIELINQFWEQDERWQFSCCETRLYFYLVKVANRLSWENSWTHSDDKTSANVGVSPNKMKSARNRLAQAGLIAFQSGGKGAGDKTRYQILIPNLTPKSQPNSLPNSIPKSQPIYIGINKHKLNKTDIPPLPPLGGESVRFVPPTMEQVAAYVVEQGYAVNAGAWCDFYASKGWMVGKTKMKDWQAAVRTWQRRIDAEQKTKNNSGLCR